MDTLEAVGGRVCVRRVGGVWLVASPLGLGMGATSHEAFEDFRSQIARWV